MIKRHQNMLLKKVGDQLQYLCVELNRSDTDFVNKINKTDSFKQTLNMFFTDVME